MNVHVRSTGITRFGKRPERLMDLLVEAGTAALEPLGRKPVDLLVVGSMLAGALGEGENLVAQVADQLALDTTSGFRIEAASATGAAAVHAAALAIATGAHHRALVVAGERMTGRATGEVTSALAESLAPGEIAVGATMPALASLVAQRYLERFGLGPDAMDLVSVHARAMSAHNPNAQFQSSVTPTEVVQSRPVALPLRLLHCAAMTDGAAALVLERGHGPVELVGLGQSTDQAALVDRADLTTFRATRVASQRAFDAAKLTPKALDVAEVHDAFAPFALIDLEDLGIYPPGEAARAFRIPSSETVNAVAINPSGGLLGRGHPVGASGLVQIVEIVRQLEGQAGPMQVPGTPKCGVAQSIGGLATHNFVTLLGRGSSP
jgi:acetyl-CoA C-acetyltransferase